jgi:hypothetical protein
MLGFLPKSDGESPRLFKRRRSQYLSSPRQHHQAADTYKDLIEGMLNK